MELAGNIRRLFVLMDETLTPRERQGNQFLHVFSRVLILFGNMGNQSQIPLYQNILCLLRGRAASCFDGEGAGPGQLRDGTVFVIVGNALVMSQIHRLLLRVIRRGKQKFLHPFPGA